MPNVEQLQRLHALEAEAAAIREEMAAKRAQEQREYADEIIAVCEDSEWDPADIGILLLPKSTMRQGTKRPVKKIWVNPKNEAQQYKGRGFPSWMREEMAAVNLDPGSKDDRLKFRDEHLEVKDAA